MEPPTFAVLVGREVKRALSDAGQSVAGASKAVGVSRETVHRWIRGETLPPLGQLEKLSRVTGQTITLVIGTDEEAASPIYWARRLREDVRVVSDLLVALDPEIAAEVEREVGAGAPLPERDGAKAAPGQPREDDL